MSDKNAILERAALALERIATCIREKDIESFDEFSDREQVTEIEAPSHSLPKWSECNLRVGNSKWLKDNDIEADHDSLTANPLHEFIYEYDDSDAYKSAWFLHRLENLIGFIRSEQYPAVAKLVEALEEMIDVAKAVDSWESFPSDPIEKAEDAVRAYRDQGGDL